MSVEIAKSEVALFVLSFAFGLVDYVRLVSLVGYDGIGGCLFIRAGVGVNSAKRTRVSSFAA